MRALTIVLCGLLALNAVPVGVMLIVAPDGHLLAARAEWLAGLPFRTYLLPGLVLALGVGGSAVAAALLTARRAPLAPLATAVCGVVVTGWMVAQLATVHVSSVLQPITLALGLAITALGATGRGADWLRWVGANAAGELVGLGLVGAGASLLAGSRALIPGLIVLGALEGLTVGLAQAWALRRLVPGTPASAWVRATVLGATVAWMLGMLPSILMRGAGGSGEGPSDALRLILAAALGAVAGPILAAFQARVLRGRVARAGWWLPANALAWAAAMPIVFQAVRLAVVVDRALAALALLLVAGAVAGATHGLALLALVRHGACTKDA